MAKTMDDILHPKGEGDANPGFPYCPEGWTLDSALSQAKEEGLTLTDEHWEAIRALQEYFEKHSDSTINARELHDALDEKFHVAGGLKHLYVLFPGGPIAQGCRIAGLEAPPGSTSTSFGSVM